MKLLTHVFHYRWLRRLCFLSLFFFLQIFHANAQSPSKKGGMYPVSMLNKAGLHEKGLNIPVNQIFNPEGSSLINGIVRIGGCTGSFVSDNGLILTNHHCIFSHLKSHSTPENNYIEKGFYAENAENEIPLDGLTVKIMKDYKDVSDEVLEGLSGVKNAVERQQQLSDNRQAVKQKYQEQFPDLKVEVSEMVPGQSYILFKYQMLKDLRMVYAPPRTVGEFGGSSDNWVWPRHTGDFSFVRAYVGEDGEPATYNKNNVPFKPDVHLDIKPEGVQSGDFVFILGYPGRTFRHRSSGYIRFHREVQLPYISDIYQWKIDRMRELSRKSEELKIKYSSRIKSISNVAKNYRGKLASMKDIDLLQQRIDEEKEVLETLAKMKGKKLKELAFYDIRSKLNAHFDSLITKGRKIFWYYQLINSSDALQTARRIHEFSKRVKKLPDSLAIDESRIISNLRKSYKKIDPYTDSMFLRKLLKQGLSFGNKNAVPALKAHFNNPNEVNDFVKSVYEAEGGVMDTVELFRQIRNNMADLNAEKIPLVKLWKDLLPDFRETDSFRRVMFSKVESLRPKYLKWKRTGTDGLFIPDANSTLRLTYGETKGYIPKDGVYYEPFTTLKGYEEKARPTGDYRPFPEMMQAIEAVKNSEFKDESIGGIPVCLLYNTHTTGGNSGSPVMDKNGDLIGLNFDRNYRGTISDYAWSDQYSRSIGVDIRFILWYLANVDKAGHLLREMDVKNGTG